MSQKSKNPAKKGLLGWIFYFAGDKKGQYFVSVFFALLSVACCIAPYFMIAQIVRQLLSGVRDWNIFLQECGIVALFWLGNVIFHAISTSMSHIATFNLLGNIRKKMWYTDEGKTSADVQLPEHRQKLVEMIQKLEK